MNRLPDNERLLNDVLGGESAADFREALLGETLRMARGRRYRRHARRIGSGAVALAVVAFLFLRGGPTAPVKPTPQAFTSYQLVASEPLPANMIVTTQPFAGSISSMAAVDVIETSQVSRGYRIIGDDELLALAPTPAALVRHGSHEAELVFVRAADEDPAPDN